MALECGNLNPWAPHGRVLPEHYRGHVSANGLFLGAPLEVAAYLREVDRCRHAFPDLRILSGIELSEGHWHPGPVAELLAAFDWTGLLAQCTPWSICKQTQRARSRRGR